MIQHGRRRYLSVYQSVAISLALDDEDEISFGRSSLPIPTYLLLRS
jgi:hypothetical protein